MFFYIAFVNILPEMTAAVEEAARRDINEGFKMLSIQAFGIAFGIILMYLLARFTGEIEVGWRRNTLVAEGTKYIYQNCDFLVITISRDLQAVCSPFLVFVGRRSRKRRIHSFYAEKNDLDSAENIYVSSNPINESSD